MTNEVFLQVSERLGRAASASTARFKASPSLDEARLCHRIHSTILRLGARQMEVNS